MFRFALLFFCFGILAYIAGSTQLAGFTMEVGRILLAACMILAILATVTAVMGRQRFRDPL